MQVKYSILDRSAETDGTLACCRDLGIAVIAHSPLQQGLLTERALQAGDSATRQQQQVRQPCICRVHTSPAYATRLFVNRCTGYWTPCGHVLLCSLAVKQGLVLRRSLLPM